MRIFKNIMTVIVCCAILVSIGSAWYSTKSQNNSGGHSGIYTLTQEDKEWVIDKFGDCPDVETLLIRVRDYAVENFKYDHNYSEYFQNFQFRKFITTNLGVCFHYASFLKVVFLEWAEFTNTDLQVYVVDIYYKGNFWGVRHSYSVVKIPSADGLADKNYYIDITSAVCRAAKGEEPLGFEMFETDIETYASMYGEVVINYH